MQKNRFLRQLHARQRLLIATALAILVVIVLPADIAAQSVTRALIAWNCGTWIYIVLASVMMMRSSQEGIRRRAQLEDEGRHLVLGLVVVAVVASLVAIAGELVVVKNMHGGLKFAHAMLATVTVLSSWAFMHVIFALHYAHDFYVAIVQGRQPGLNFPGDKKPGYSDFFYFSAIIGTSGQTADVALVSSAMRRLGTVHCILSFFFNTTVLALMINIAAGVI